MRPGYKLKLNSLRPRRRHRARTTRCSASASSTRRCAASSSPARRTACSARAPTSSCSACRSHAWKVNFCKFTNETRNGIEDASRHSGLKFIAAVNGACAGGGYELALACDEICAGRRPLLVGLAARGAAARRAARHRRPDARHRQAPACATTSPTSSAPRTEGVRGQRAKDWRLVDAIVKPARVRAAPCSERAQALAARSDRPARRAGASRCRRSSAHRRRDAAVTTSTSTSTIDRARAHRDVHRARAAPRRSPTRRRGHRGRGRALVAARDGARARRRDPHRCAPTSSTSARGS